MTSPLKVSGIDHVVFHVKDLARARKFYVDFLGLEVDHERSWQCFLKCGNQGVALFEVDDGEDVHGGSEVNHMALRLAAGDLERTKRWWMRALKSTAARAIQPASIFTTLTGINCSY
jgi:catechol 2,3-dioxygenase-like lactoylglutathione lyase family enzyme